MLEDEEIKTLQDLNFPPRIFAFCEDIELFTENAPERLFWYLIFKYGLRKPLKMFQAMSEFKEAAEIIFLANNSKYKKLFATLVDYNPFEPYNIVEEHVTGETYSKETVTPTGSSTTTPNGSVTTAKSETSFDDLSPKLADEEVTTYNNSETTSFNNQTTKEYANNISDSFEGKTLNNLSNSSHSYDSRRGNIGNHVYADIIRKEREQAMFTLWDIIAKDIIDLTCYKIIF